MNILSVSFFTLAVLSSSVVYASTGSSQCEGLFKTSIQDKTHLTIHIPIRRWVELVENKFLPIGSPAEERHHELKDLHVSAIIIARLAQDPLLRSIDMSAPYLGARTIGSTLVYGTPIAYALSRYVDLYVTALFARASLLSGTVISETLPDFRSDTFSLKMEAKAKAGEFFEIAVTLVENKETR